MVFIILLVAHLLLCALVLLGIHFDLLKVHRYMFFVALLIPFWGVFLLLILHFKIFIRKGSDKVIGVEKMKLSSELYKSVTVDEGSVSSTVVPIEEALVVNSARERRTIIMDVLNDNPKEYITFLQKAGNNEDTEVVHYAVTAMVEISKENDCLLQDFERQYSADPENYDLLCRYTDFLWSALSQNVMQGQVELLNRTLFSDLIDKKLSIQAELEDYVRAVKNALHLKNYTYAAEKLDRMEALYGNHEEFYLTRLSYLAALGKGSQIATLLQELEEKRIFLSAAAKEVLAFWKT